MLPFEVGGIALRTTVLSLAVAEAAASFRATVRLVALPPSFSEVDGITLSD